MEAVESKDLVKIYSGKEKVEALRGISLSIRKGELFTLLGPNGAGKTTFQRIVSTQLLPTSGEAYVLGDNVITQPEEVRKHMAVVPQDIRTYDNFTPWEYAYYFAELHGLSKSKAKENAEEALKAVDLWNLKNRICGSLSGGERRRAIIASALSSDADIFILDEPTSGLDAVARRHTWRALTRIVNEGKTILLTTHIMEEAEMVSDRLAIINKGRVVTEGTLEDIKNLSDDKFRVIIEGDIDKLGFLGKRDGLIQYGSKNIMYLKNEDEALEIVKKALGKGLKAEAAPITLEDVFVKLVGGETDENQNF